MVDVKIEKMVKYRVLKVECGGWVVWMIVRILFPFDVVNVHIIIVLTFLVKYYVF